MIVHWQALDFATPGDGLIRHTPGDPCGRWHPALRADHEGHEDHEGIREQHVSRPVRDS